MADWSPSATARARLERARMNRAIRAFFEERRVLEVETPLLGRYGVTDPNIECIPAADGFLQSSPEYHMKRLLAAGSGPIYQITRAFRAGEQGRRHNPEFSMLEWYRPGYDMTALVDECLELFRHLLGPLTSERHSYRQLFRQHLDLDPLTAGDAHLRAVAMELEPALPPLDRQALLDWLLAVHLEPRLPTDRLVVIQDFPAEAAALAEIVADADGHAVARRFEIFHAGRELANGYKELTDLAEQRRRFETDRRLRSQRGQPDRHADPRLLAALQAGLPACAGVAVGLDRLLMCLLDVDDIGAVLNFPAPRH